MGSYLETMGPYRATYRKLFEFHERHLGVSTEEGWEALAEDAAENFRVPFEADLCAAVIRKLEWQYESGMWGNDGS